MRVDPWERASIEGLAKVEVFSQCSRRQLACIGRLGTQIQVGMGCVLMKQGAVPREFYVTLLGTADVYVDEVLGCRLQPGSFFGEIGLLDRRPRLATVAAATPMSLLVFTPVEFRALLEVAPPVTATIMRTHAGRLRTAARVVARLEAQRRSSSRQSAHASVGLANVRGG